MRNRHIRWLLPGLALACGGCTTMRTIPAAKQTPGSTFSHSLVYARGGERYEFNRIEFFPDTLAGEVKVQEARQSAEYGVYYEDVMKTVRLPRSGIDSVAVVQRDVGKTFLYGAGFVALAAGIKAVVGNGNTQGTSTAGGKSPGSGP